MTRLITRTTITLLLVALLSLAFTAAMVVPASAEHPSGEDDDTLSDTLGIDDDGFLATVSEVATGLGERFGYRAKALNPFSEVTPASDHANDTSEVFNENSGTLTATANNHDLAAWFSHYSDRSNNRDVVRVEFTDQDGGSATRFIVAEYNATSDDYDSVTMTESTDYAVDSNVELEPRASENAAGELETFVDEHAGNNSDLPKSYRRGLAAKYGGDVESPLIPDVGFRELMDGL